MSDLHVFVDESGNHTRRDCYVVAGCWCISRGGDLERILRPTKNRISDNVVFDAEGASPGREIKGSAVSETKLNSIFAYMRNVVERDRTIDTRNYPWENFPVAFTVYDSDSDVGKGISRRYLGEGRSHTPPQVFGLSSIISPALRIEEQHSSSIESYRIVLDAETWKRPRAQLESVVRSIDWAPSLDFTVRDTERTPGIQLADVAAHARRKRLRDGVCHEAMRYLNKLLL